MDATILFLVVLFAAAGLAGFAFAGSTRWAVARPEKWLVTAILVLTLIPTGVGDSTEGSLFRQITWGGIFAFCAVIVFRSGLQRQLLPLSKLVPVPLALLVAYVVASVCWSDHPGIALRRASQIVGVMIIALAFARLAQSGSDLHRRLLGPVVTFTCAGIAITLLLPGFGIDHDGALRAFTTHKNTWGAFSALACITVALALGRRESKHRCLLLLGLVICLSSLVASRSVTSIVAVTIVLAGWLFWYGTFNAGSVGKVVIAVFVCIGLISIHAYLLATGELPFQSVTDATYSLLERNRSLTGREYLWQLMETEILRHPWFGLGYGSFWQGTTGSSRWIVDRLNWGPPSQAHNGYLDILNELGLVGLLLLGFVIVRHVINLILIHSRGGREVAWFHGAILLTVLLTNWTETSLLRTTHLLWIVLCISIVEVHLRVQAADAYRKTETRTAAPRQIWRTMP